MPEQQEPEIIDVEPERDQAAVEPLSELFVPFDDQSTTRGHGGSGKPVRARVLL